MFKQISITELEASIDHFYAVHSAKRVTLAALLVGIVSIGVAWGVYYSTVNVFLAIGAFAVSSLITVNVAMFGIVPPTMGLANSKAFIVGALKEPLRIKSVTKKHVQLEDAQGRVRRLNGFERVLWRKIITPYLIGMHTGASVAEGSQSEAARLTNTEKKVFEKHQAELGAKEKALRLEREKLRVEREELEERNSELEKAENIHLDRISRVEMAEAELTKQKDRLERSDAAKQSAVLAAENATLVQQKEAALQAKGDELESLSQRLQADRELMDAQQAKLESMKGALLREQAASGGTAAAHKARELEARASELDERMRCVADLENDLIERLNQLSEREASVNQIAAEANHRDD